MQSSTHCNSRYISWDLAVPRRPFPKDARVRQPAAALPTAEPSRPQEIPPMGWLWQAGRGPTASATVANLKLDRIKPKKSLGQNFLTDDSILQNIVKAAGVMPGDVVLEVGPGTGNLTKHLLARGAIVTALEKDDTLFGRLVKQYKDEPNLRVVHGDVLRVDVDAMISGMMLQERAAGAGGSEACSTAGTSAAAPPSVRPAAAPGGKVKVVANLPYNITKEFLKLMLPKGQLVSELSIMIQEEVAQRLVNREAGRPDYRAMNLRVLFYSNPKYRFLIPKERYFPVPGVDGALVTFALLAPGRRQEVPSERGFIALVGKAFLERRKMMRNSVQPLYSAEQVEAALRVSGLRTDARAQDLSLEEFVRVHRALGSAVAAELLTADEEGEEL